MKKERLPIFYLNKKVLFPFCTISLKLLLKPEELVKEGDRVAALPIRSILDIIFARFKTATLGEVQSIIKEDETFSLQLKGISRIRLRRLHKFRTAEYDVIQIQDLKEGEGIIDILRKKTQELIFLVNVDESDKLIHLLSFINNPDQLTDFISHYFIAKFSRRLKIFNELKVEKKVNQLIRILDRLIKNIKKREKGKIVKTWAKKS